MVPHPSQRPPPFPTKNLANPAFAPPGGRLLPRVLRLDLVPTAWEFARYRTPSLISTHVVRERVGKANVPFRCKTLRFFQLGFMRACILLFTHPSTTNPPPSGHGSYLWDQCLFQYPLLGAGVTGSYVDTGTLTAARYVAANGSLEGRVYPLSNRFIPSVRVNS